MRIIARRTLPRFIDQIDGQRDQRSVKNALEAWFDEVRKATLTSYRLVMAVDYLKSIVWIKWLGTHADYDRIDVSEVNHEP